MRETQRGYFFFFVGKQVQQLFSNLMHCGNNRKINNKPEKLFLFKQKARFFALTFLNIFPVDGKRKTYCKERQEKERCPESNLYLKVEKMNAKPGNMSTLPHLYSPENHPWLSPTCSLVYQEANHCIAGQVCLSLHLLESGDSHLILAPKDILFLFGLFLFLLLEPVNITLYQ